MNTKSLIFGLALLVVTIGQASAQSFKLGLEAGANFSNFIGSGISGNTLNGSKLGLVGGAFLSLNFGTSFAIQPEILYEQKGNQISGTSTTTELDYIEIPVLLKISLGTPMVNPGILLGPTFSFNTVAQSAGGNISGVSSSDVGVMGGVEVDIDKFLVSGRYELGLNNITTGSNVQNGTITLLVGYSFI